MDAVVALRVTTKLTMSASINSIGSDRQLPSCVVHSVAVTVLEDTVIDAAAPFPRFVMFQYDLLRDRMMQSQLCFAGKSVDQPVFDEQFTPRTDVNCLWRLSDCRKQSHFEDQQNSKAAHHWYSFSDLCCLSSIISSQPMRRSNHNQCEGT